MSHVAPSETPLVSVKYCYKNGTNWFLAKVGLLLNIKQFPWATLGGILSEHRVRIVNWPIGILFPKLDKSRGITGLPIPHTNQLIQAMAPSAKQRLIFEYIPEDEIQGRPRSMYS